MWGHVTVTSLFLAVVKSDFRDFPVSNEDKTRVGSGSKSAEFHPVEYARTDEEMTHLKHKLIAYESYEVPTPAIELLKPKGFRISIPGTCYSVILF